MSSKSGASQTETRGTATSQPRTWSPNILWIRIGAILAVFGLCGSCVTQVPVWDELISVFPAAIALSENGFNYVDLLSRPAASDGEPPPTTHCLTLATLATALAYRLTEGGVSTFVILHMVHMTIAGLAIAEVFRFARPVLGVVTSILLSLAFLVFPLFLCQARAMYLEISQLLFTLLAINAWAEQRRCLSGVWTILAVLSKPTGIVLAVTLGALELLAGGTWRRRLTRSLCMVLPGGAVFVLQASLAYSVGVLERPSIGAFLKHLSFVFSNVWDLLVMLVLFVVIAIFRGRFLGRSLACLWANDTGAGELGDGDRRRLSAFGFGLALLGFYMLAPVSGVVPVLARYFLPMLPFAGLAMVDSLCVFLPQRVVRGGLCAVSLFFVANSGGMFYPRHQVNDFSIAQRSTEYREYLAAQQESVLYLPKLPRLALVLYGLFNHYMVQYAKMGYVQAPLSNGHCAGFESYWWSVRAKDFPDEFYMLIDNPYLGGDVLERLFRTAELNPALSNHRHPAVRARATPPTSFAFFVHIPEETPSDVACAEQPASVNRLFQRFLRRLRCAE